jgi:hypothetical protein
MIKIASILIGGLRRAFTKSGGSLSTVSAPVTNAYDLEAYVALFLRGLIAIALAWVAMQVGVPVPDISTL